MNKCYDKELSNLVMKGYEHQLKRSFIPWKQPLRLRQSATVNPVSLKLRSILFCLSSPKRSERAIPLFDYVCVHACITEMSCASL